MKAVVVEKGNAIVVHERPKPKVRDHFVLIKVTAVALNPTDWKHLDYRLVADGCLVGCDFAGTVVEVGKGVNKALSTGDRVAGVAHGGNSIQPEDGAFAEYIVAKGDILIKLPGSLSFEEAATLPLGVATVMQGLYQKGLKLRLPNEPNTEKPFVLIYGGATATGALGIQYARLSGYSVVTTCSPQNFEYVKFLGASEAFDYKDANVGASIRKLTKDGLKLSWDIISNEDSAKVCAAALSSDPTGCRYASFLSNRSPRDDVESVGTNMYTVWGEYFKSGSLEYPANQADFDWAKGFMELAEKLLAAGRLKAHRIAIKDGGLNGVLQGLNDMKSNRVSAEKLVYRVAEMV
ncbi:putative zinc-binding oxidoreductase ToxD [Exophiala viscosa]|uniref:Zinc-binding oxidoreductase ToxD n=1 Tax=Exophiala viscosa TaxID=2486360 RepID=A0AAN6E698_9EURO|nr:putative zinc-binding oxidoreductase ToxD [Exophiala viscosa]KAI1626529.1 putative zinc-binding oxidoreductase ToxD [Exophiala viscosa]